jgi:transposase
MANAMLEDRHEGGVYRRVEVITGRWRRHNWTREEKTRIVAESLDPEANISDVARRNGVSRGLLTVWRRQARELAASPSSQAMFATVQIEGATDGHEGAALSDDKIAVGVASAIEVEICGATIRVPRGADRATLDTVISALRGTR